MAGSLRRLRIRLRTDSAPRTVRYVDIRRVVACALAAELVVAGGVAVARLPARSGTATLVAAAGAEPSYTPYVTPLPTPSALPTPTVPVPSPTVSLPPLPPITLPPLPTVSIPPLPTVSVPPLRCPEDLGAAELPAVAQKVDIRRETGQPRGLLSGAGRLWFSTMDGEGAPHITGIDPSNGARLAIPTPNSTFALDVTGTWLWAAESTTRAVVVHDTRTGTELRRYDSSNLGSEGTPLHAFAGTGDAQGGGWVLGGPAAGDESFVAVARVRADGTVAWTTRIPVPPPTGFGWGRGNYLVEHGGSAYVAWSSPRLVSIARIDASGTVAALREIAIGTDVMGPVPMAVTSKGLYALVYPDGGPDAQVTRLHPGDLRVLGTARADEAYDLVADENDVYVLGEVCSFLLSRFDPVSMARTGFWRTDRWDEGMSGAILGGRLWTLFQLEGVPKALHRHDLG